MTAPVTCRRPGCGRRLTSESSVARGIGRSCQRREREEAAILAEAVAPYSQSQRDRALSLIARGGITPTNRDGVYRAKSSDGQRSYLVLAAGNCSCPAGERDVRCVHLLAVHLYDLGQRLSLTAYGKAA